MSSKDRYFEGTCETVDLEICGQGVYLDACTCQNYFRCSSQEILTLTCSEDTLWDHELQNCNHAKNVVIKYLYCDADNAWQRCNVSESRLQDLEYFCTNATTSSTTSTTTVLPNTTAPSGGVNAGIVIGLIAAVAVISLILNLVALCVLYRRRLKRPQIQKERPSVQNPEFVEGGNNDDQYAIDATMNDPAFNTTTGGTTMARSNGTLPPIPSNYEDCEETGEYYNSALKGDTTLDNGGYLDMSRRSCETPISVSILHSLNAGSSKTNEHRPTNPGVQKGRPSVQNPEFFERGNNDGQYVTMNEPASTSSTTMARSNGTLPPIPPDYVNCEENGEYYNTSTSFEEETALKRLGNGDYTDMLRRSVREYETPINVSAPHSLNSD